MEIQSLELVNTDWFDADAMKLPPYRVGRVNYGKGRAYIRIDEGGVLESPFKIYTSLTTAINAAAPMEKPLLEWYVKHGLAEADRLLVNAQHYGTLMHKLIGDFLMHNLIDLRTIKAEVENYCAEHNFWQPECYNWTTNLKHDLAAFAQFCEDYQIKPLAIEYVLLSKKGYGTLIDLVCKMTIEEKGFFGEVYKTGEKKGQPKESKRSVERMALINFKSGRHAFYRTNGIQIEAEKQIFEENFPDIKIDAAYNWSPKDWRTEPGYNLKNWYGEIEMEEVDAILKLAQIRFEAPALRRKYKAIDGVISRKNPVKGNIEFTDLETYCLKNFSSIPV